MDKTLNEFFERLKNEGIRSHYSTANNKIYISATKKEDVEKVKPLLKKYRLRLSFIDSANSNVIFENKIGDNEINLNVQSMLLTVCPSFNIIEAEKYLNTKGFTIGYYFPPILTCKEMTFLDWLKNCHIPSLNYYSKDLSGNIRGIAGILPDGNIFDFIKAPKMATGPDLIRLLLLLGENLFSPSEVTIKVHHLKNDIQILSFSSQKLKNVLSALSSIALKNIKIEFATLYTREDEHSDPVLEVGYVNNKLFDYKNWIIRTVNNEGVSLINTISDYDMIRERLNGFVNHDCQIEIHSKYKSISKVDDIVKFLSQNIRFNGYLYRYERSSFSFRLIIPSEYYQQVKDNLVSEFSKYKGEIRITECSKNISNEIPLSIYSRLIHSCS